MLCSRREGRDVSQNGSDWCVVLIGGMSAARKTVISERLRLSLGMPWIHVDDLRLVFLRDFVSLPGSTGALHFFDNTPHHGGQISY